MIPIKDFLLDFRDNFEEIFSMELRTENSWRNLQFTLGWENAVNKTCTQDECFEALELYKKNSQQFNENLIRRAIEFDVIEPLIKENK